MITAQDIRCHLIQEPSLNKTTPNDFGGFDSKIRGTDKFVRVIPIDGEWGAGVEIFVFSKSETVLSSATLHGCSMAVVGVVVAMTEDL